MVNEREKKEDLEWIKKPGKVIKAESESTQHRAEGDVPDFIWDCLAQPSKERGAAMQNHLLSQMLMEEQLITRLPKSHFEYPSNFYLA